MALPSITTRIDKGEPLTFTEMDGNLENLRDATISVTGDSGTSQDINLNDTITVAGGTGVNTVASATNTVTVNLDNTTVSAGAYTAANITVDAQGRITTASSGTIPTDTSELTNGAGYITTYAETDPVVGAVMGIVKADGMGTISAATAGTDYVASETVTSISLATNTLSYVDEDGTTTNIDLSLYLDDTNLARLTSGSLNAMTGVATFTRDDATTFDIDFSALLNVTLADLSVTSASASGNGSLTYNNSTGVFSFTPADLSSVSSNVVDDTSPQLGGNLDLAGNSIVDPTNGTVNINGFEFGGNIAVSASGSVASVHALDRITLDDTGTNLGLANGDPIRFTGSDVGAFGGGLTVGTIYYINFAFGTGFGHIELYTAPVGDPGRTQISGFNTGYTITDMQYEAIEVITPSTGDLVGWNGTALVPGPLKGYKETINALSYAATITPDVANGNVQTVTLTGNVTINGFTNAEAGQSLTIILTQDATGSRILTTTMKMAGGDATLSTDPNAIDILGIFYDGTNYYGSLSTAFATPS